MALKQAVASRKSAHRFVQRNAMKTRERGADFLAELKADPEVSSKISNAALEAMFDEAYHFKHVDTIFARVFGAIQTGRERPRNCSSHQA